MPVGPCHLPLLTAEKCTSINQTGDERNNTRDASNDSWPPRSATSPASAQQPAPPLPRQAASCAATYPTSAPSRRSGPPDRSPSSPLPPSPASPPSGRRSMSSRRARRPPRVKTHAMIPRFRRCGWGSSGSATSGSSSRRACSGRATPCWPPPDPTTPPTAPSTGFASSGDHRAFLLGSSIGLSMFL
jgi:hypothetical protein